MTPKDKPPRQWAAEIAALCSLNERRQSLEKVPAHLRSFVETHLRNAWALRRYGQGR